LDPVEDYPKQDSAEEMKTESMDDDKFHIQETSEDRMMNSFNKYKRDKQRNTDLMDVVGQ
jgi:hypothetical protein